MRIYTFSVDTLTCALDCIKIDMQNSLRNLVAVIKKKISILFAKYQRNLMIMNSMPIHYRINY